MITDQIRVGGKPYYTLKRFAELTKRSEQAIRLLIIKGNRLATLGSVKIGRSILIPCSELTEFPFCCSGRSKSVLHFNEDGTEYMTHEE